MHFTYKPHRWAHANGNYSATDDDFFSVQLSAAQFNEIDRQCRAFLLRKARAERGQKTRVLRGPRDDPNEIEGGSSVRRRRSSPRRRSSSPASVK